MGFWSLKCKWSRYPFTFMSTFIQLFRSHQPMWSITIYVHVTAGDKTNWYSLCQSEKSNWLLCNITGFLFNQKQFIYVCSWSLNTVIWRTLRNVRDISAVGTGISSRLTVSLIIQRSDSPSRNILPNTEAEKTQFKMYTQSNFQFMIYSCTVVCFFSDRQQHSEMDVGRERSTWGEYLHSLTVSIHDF